MRAHGGAVGVSQDPGNEQESTRAPGGVSGRRCVPSGGTRKYHGWAVGEIPAATEQSSPVTLGQADAGAWGGRWAGQTGRVGAQRPFQA